MFMMQAKYYLKKLVIQLLQKKICQIDNHIVQITKQMHWIKSQLYQITKGEWGVLVHRGGV